MASIGVSDGITMAQGGICTSVAERLAAMKAAIIDHLRRPIDTGRFHIAALPDVWSTNPDGLIPPEMVDTHYPDWTVRSQLPM